MKTAKLQSEADPVEEFIAFPEVEKDFVVKSLTGKIAKSRIRKLTSAEMNRFAKIQKRMRARPKVHESATKVLVTIDRGLLRRADAFASDHGLTRAELLAEALKEKIAAARPRPPKRPAA